MGLWKNAGVSTCLQFDYGFSKRAAETHSQMAGSVDYLPGFSVPIKRLKKQEIAAWLALAQCSPNEGTMKDDPAYLRHVELTIAKEHRKGKIRVPIYIELEEYIRAFRDPDLRQALIDVYEPEKEQL